MISDRYTNFQGHFWRTLWKNIGTKLNFTSAYHPQSDGKTQIVNRSIRNILMNLVGDHPKKCDRVNSS